MSVKPKSPSINAARRIRATTDVSVDSGYAQSRSGHTLEKFFSPALRLQTVVHQTPTRMKFDMIVAPIGGDFDRSGQRAGILCREIAGVRRTAKQRLYRRACTHLLVAAEWQTELGARTAATSTWGR
jgi:hypothetical protein